ncbi:MAG TPA: lipocalin family protein [Cytophagaceae bacterium]
MKENTKILIASITGITAGITGYMLYNKFRYPPLKVCNKVDLQRYSGQWYEIARLPNRFENDCFNSKASYSFNPDGSIKIINSCHDEKGKTKFIEGTAFVSDKETNARLKVRFSWPFSGDYNILKVGKNYDYALVGTESRENLWILSRNEFLDMNIVEELLEVAEQQGFNTRRLILRK